MTRLAVTVLTLSALALTAGSSFAGSRERDAVLDANRAREQAAIENGRHTGALTRREYRELTAEQARIHGLERKAEADGYVSRREFREIRDAQKQADHHIYQDVRNEKISYWRRWLYLHRS